MSIPAKIQTQLSISEYTLDELLQMAVERRASDLHVTAGLPPMLRIDGRLRPLNFDVLTPNETQRLIYGILSDRHISEFERSHELDMSHGIPRLGRFRVNVYIQRGSISAALRVIPTSIPTFEQLGLPAVLGTLCTRTSGLVLVTGPTGAGKSTTLASMIDHINQSRDDHVLTIEDPIEYLHDHGKCMINQRELGSDTFDIPAALRSALREDPDVVLVGEMRDLATIEAALTIAETGHLVFGTLHTRNAPQSIDRIVDVFPPHQQEQVRVQLANTLEAVIAQQLLPKFASMGRAPAVEILMASPAVRNLIREAKTHQIYSLMETGAELGMQTMDRSLANLVRRGIVNAEDAACRAVDLDNFKRWISNI